MPELVFNPPDAQAPGFLRRQKKSLVFIKAFDVEQPTPDMIDEMVDFLVDYVTEPADRNEAKELLWDASQEQIMALMQAVGGNSGEGDGNPTEQ
jgi:hypothetical protein